MAYEGVNAIGQGYVLPVPAQPGLTGADGRDGRDGEDGQSAYQIAVAAGFDGTEQDFANQLLARAAGGFARSAAVNIPARRIVVDLGNGLAGVVDPTNPAQAGLVIGIVLQYTPAGSNAVVQQGELGSAVQFVFGGPGPLYIADDGTLTLTPRTSGFSQVVGFTPDGVTVVIALGHARPIVSLGGGVIVQPSFPTLLSLLFSGSPDNPIGLNAGAFYRNGYILERVPAQPDTSVSTAAVLQELRALWSSLPASPDGLGSAAPYVNGRTLSFTTPPSNPSPTPIPPIFKAAFGALWDGLPDSPVGLDQGEFYRNGRSLERIPAV